MPSNYEGRITMSEITTKYISECVSQTFEQNKSYIKKRILQNTTDTQSTEEVFSQMLNNAIMISSEISVHLTLNLLSQMELIGIEIEDTEKEYSQQHSQSHLKLIWDSSTPELFD